jgi:hypothetical protein
MLACMTPTETKWLERVREWKDSGLTAKQFVEGKQYRASSLVWRHWQLQRNGQLEGTPIRAGKVEKEPVARGRKRVATGAALPKRAVEAVSIARVIRRPSTLRHAVAASDKAGVVVEIGLARIEVASGFDVAVLKDVVRALQGAA